MVAIMEDIALRSLKTFFILWLYSKIATFVLVLYYIETRRLLYIMYILQIVEMKDYTNYSLSFQLLILPMILMFFYKISKKRPPTSH